MILLNNWIIIIELTGDKKMTARIENVVISGIGGVFPESDNVEELKELLFSKTNGVTIDSKRWSQSTY